MDFRHVLRCISVLRVALRAHAFGSGFEDEMIACRVVTAAGHQLILLPVRWFQKRTIYYPLGPNLTIKQHNPATTL